MSDKCGNDGRSNTHSAKSGLPLPEKNPLHIEFWWDVLYGQPFQHHRQGGKERVEVVYRPYGSFAFCRNHNRKNKWLEYILIPTEERWDFLSKVGYIGDMQRDL
jgi:hypothetical protein